MKWTAREFFKHQLGRRAPVEKADLAGQTVVIIGANTGLGYEAAKHFATMNPSKLVLGCRSRERGEDALSRLTAETGYTSAVLSLVDLADFSSVSAFADRFEAEHERLDIAIYNAALWNPKHVATKDGWESSLQVNNLATPLLALRLLPLMQRTAKTSNSTPRLVVVSSEVHYQANVVELNDILAAPHLLNKMSDKEYCDHLSGRERYYQSKLAVTPGFCVSELRRNLVAGSWIMSFLERIVSRLIGFTSEEGSRMLVFGGIGMRGDEKSVRGQFLLSSTVVEPSDFVLSDLGKRFEEKYWDELIELLSKADEKIPDVLKETGIA
ncbi:NAD(P)-binding protein [Cylindrobasidium torrendii FP15055 ss-10]|uniref:NAD(P)-binding protein n=1 Tax=Cylindrobasidium torrendii FP15055 ss-10 TaxID=1314674 RepID=A0A0D7AY03_9AGAR|nr:NAD(P)-binding protein [Cylindrobasidium torrendii FP15055 ss-10]